MDSEFPQKITELPGLSKWEEYNGVDIDGKHYSPSQVGEDPNLRLLVSANPENRQVYRTPEGGFTTNLSASISINKDTGNIKIKAPQVVLDSDAFKRNYVDSGVLQKLSQAYKMDPNYKFPVEETNPETGEKEEKKYSIDEYIEKLNEELMDQDKGIVKYIEEIEDKRNEYRHKYGGYADAFTEDQIATSQDYNGKAVPMPDFMVNFNGVSGFPSWFEAVKNNVVNGAIKVEDFNKFYNRDNLGREDIATILATLDRYIENAESAGKNPETNYSDTYIDEETGEEKANPFRPDELARAIALKNYILTHDPEANALQAMWDGWNILFENASYGLVRTFSNLDNMVEAVVTGGEGQMMQQWIDYLDAKEAENNYKNALVTDSTAILSTLGTIGGTILGTKLIGDAAGAVVDKALSFGTGAGEAAAILSKSDDISAGARLMLKANTLAQNVSVAASIARNWVNSQGVLPFATRFLLDTVHDAMLYDSNTLRKTLQASDQETRDYWLGQLADNAKWWAGMSLAKGALKGSKFAVGKIGDTSFGQWLNAHVSKDINKLAAFIGDKKSTLKDRVAGGDLVRKLETQLDKAIKNGDNAKANRIKRKIQQTEWNDLLRDARKNLGNVELDTDGAFKLTSKSAEDFVDAQNRIRALENGIDSYNRSIDFKRQEMIGQQIDPSTGKMAFINPSLGGANVKVSDVYVNLADLAQKYNLPAKEGSLISGSMVDYLVGKYHQDILQSFVDAGGPKAADAMKALEVVRANLEDYAKGLPDEIISYINNNYKAYTEFYAKLNEYGKAKGLLDVEKITSYENNPIWSKNGYMPIKLENDQVGHWAIDDERINATVEQELRHHKFNEQPGQHYVDPELVRQSRIDSMARAEINSNLWKAYSSSGSSATDEVIISGEQSKYVQSINDGKNSVESAVAKEAKALSESIDVKLTKSTKASGKKASVNQKIESVAGMSPSETNQVLLDKGILTAETPRLIDNFSDSESFERWYGNQTKDVQNFIDRIASENGFKGTEDGLIDAKYNAFQEGIKSDAGDIEAGLQRAYLSGDKDFLSSSVASDAARNIQDGKNAFYDNTVKADAKKNLKNISGVDVNALVDDTANNIRSSLDKYVDGVLSDNGVKTAMVSLGRTANGADSLGRYIALSRLKDDYIDSLYKSIDESIDKSALKKGILHDDVSTIQKEARSMADKIIENEINDAAGTVRTINPDLLNANGIYSEAKKLADQIEKLDKDIKTRQSTDVIMYLDEQGRQVFTKVDPAFASLFNYRFKMTKADASSLAKINAALSKMFRWGTTSVNLSSFGNQLFRDFGNALTIGGSWRTIKANADNLVDVLGDNIVEQIKRFDPSGYEYRQVEQLAEQTGQSIKEAAVSRELMRGAAISPTTTERTLYKDFMKQAYGGDADTMLTSAKTRLQELVDKYNPEELLNGKRENYLRNRTYANSLNEALSNGYSLEQSRTFAEFAMNNATTNFSRQLYHMQAIADSTPYFRAAINGTKSFWRMWSLDPVGISGRVVGGLILPAMFLTGVSLSSEENKKIYKNIPEYQKENNLIFVLDGSVVSIPMPQELGSIVAPFRQFVEYLNDANTNDFWELMMNDALGLSPVDLTAFTTVDMDKMIADPTILDRLSRGTSRVFSQMAPIPLKTAYMLATGIDPYTGKKLNDPSYVYWNDETNSIEKADYTQNAFIKWFVSLFGDDTNATLAEKIISGIVGTTGLNVLGDMTALLQEGPEAWRESALTNATKQASKPFTVEVYDQADSAWKRAVRQLTAEKNAITSSDKWATLNKELSQAKDPEKRKAILSERQNLIDDFQQRVSDTVKRLESVYNGTFDRQKFAATLQLLNFGTDPGYQSGSMYSSQLTSDATWNSRDEAVHLMRQMGITGADDFSIFGYLTTDKDGQPVVKYTQPTAIMDMKNIIYNASNINLGNIRASIENSTLNDEKREMQKQVNAIYDKDKLSQADYNKIDAIHMEWNNRVLSTVAPYIESVSAEAIVNDDDIVKYLEDYIYVPSEWEKVNNRYISSGGGKIDKNAAFIKSYLRKVLE